MSNTQVLSLGRRISKGRSSEIFSAGEGRVLKIFHQAVPLAAVRHELENQVRAFALELPVPKPFGVCEFDGRFGILMEACSGINLLELVSYDDSAAEFAGQLLASNQLSVSSVSGQGYPSMRRKLIQACQSVDGLTTDQHQKITVLANQLSEGEGLCHGDLHPGNLLVDGERTIIADWCDACQGSPEADIARTLVILQFGRPGKVNEALRTAIIESYRSNRLSVQDIDSQQLECWMTLMMAARMQEPVDSDERQNLSMALAKRLKDVTLH